MYILSHCRCHSVAILNIILFIGRNAPLAYSFVALFFSSFFFLSFFHLIYYTKYCLTVNKKKKKKSVRREHKNEFRLYVATEPHRMIDAPAIHTQCHTHNAPAQIDHTIAKFVFFLFFFLFGSSVQLLNDSINVHYRDLLFG